MSEECRPTVPNRTGPDRTEPNQPDHTQPALVVVAGGKETEQSTPNGVAPIGAEVKQSRSSPSRKRKPTQRPKVLSENQAMWAALVAACTYPPRTDAERGKWNKAISDLLKAGETPESVGSLAVEFRKRNTVPCTPMAMAGQVGLLRGTPSPVGGRRLVEVKTGANASGPTEAEEAEEDRLNQQVRARVGAIPTLNGWRAEVGRG